MDRLPFPYLPDETHLNLERSYLPQERKSHSAPAEYGYRANNGCEESSENHNITKRKKRVSPEQWRKVRESIFGHAPFITEAVAQIKNPKLFLLANIIQCILLSVSNTIFISNPLSGIIILTTMCFSAPISAFLAIITLSAGIFTAVWIVRLPIRSITGGSITFNCFLFGSLIGPFVGGATELHEVIRLIPICIASGAFVIFSWAGLNGVLRNMPVLNAPCNILALIFIYSGLSTEYAAGHSSTELVNSSFYLNLTSSYNEDLNETKINLLMRKSEEQELLDNNNVMMYEECISRWCGIIEGIVKAQGLIFQTNSFITSSIVFLSILLYSPILFFQQLLGSAIGTLIGVGLSEQLSDVYDGNFGYNSLLTSAALGGIFIALNFQSWLLSVFASILTALMYSALVKSQLPALGIPFMFVTWLFIPMANISDDPDEASSCHTLKRVSDFTTPEIQQKVCHGCSKTIISNEKYRRPISTVLPL